MGAGTGCMKFIWKRITDDNSECVISMLLVHLLLSILTLILLRLRSVKDLSLSFIFFNASSGSVSFSGSRANNLGGVNLATPANVTIQSLLLISNKNNVLFLVGVGMLPLNKRAIHPSLEKKQRNVLLLLFLIYKPHWKQSWMVPL